MSIELASVEIARPPRLRSVPLFARSEHEAWLVLAGTEGIGPMTFAALVRVFGSARDVLLVASEPGGSGRIVAAGIEAGERPWPDTALAQAIADAAGQASHFLQRLGGLGLRGIALHDEEYPERLRKTEMPPPALFVHGSAEALTMPAAVAVVGTRHPTERGRRTAAEIAGALVESGAVVVSGLAIGIDGAAHAAALDASGRTVAVLGGGHARLFPRAHAGLAEAIAASGGAVISESPPDETPCRGTFPRRNRLISGLSLATVVVEAGEGSGALITAKWALEQGRGCFIVPGPLGAPASAGALRFLRECADEARIVVGIPELIEDLELPDPVAAAEGAGPAAGATERGPGKVERRLLELLAPCPASADALASAAGLPVATVLAAITSLELAGFVTAVYGRYVATRAGRARLRPKAVPGGSDGKAAMPIR